MKLADVGEGLLLQDNLEILDEGQCLTLLAGSSVGRVGVSIAALPAIFPVNFTLSGRDIIFKTAEGTKFSAAASHAVVAFQCDSVDPVRREGWAVLAIGRADPVTEPAEVKTLDKLPLDSWIDEGLNNYVRIPIEFISGRRIVQPDASSPAT